MINWHSLILDGKQIQDDALPDLEYIRELIPEVLHDNFDRYVERFETTLSQCVYKERK
jgi:hypothetical protein